MPQHCLEAAGNGHTGAAGISATTAPARPPGRGHAHSPAGGMRSARGGSLPATSWRKRPAGVEPALPPWQGGRLAPHHGRRRTNLIVKDRQSLPCRPRIGAAARGSNLNYGRHGYGEHNLETGVSGPGGARTLVPWSSARCYTVSATDPRCAGPIKKVGRRARRRALVSENPAAGITRGAKTGAARTPARRNRTRYDARSGNVAAGESCEATLFASFGHERGGTWGPEPRLES